MGKGSSSSLRASPKGNSAAERKDKPMATVLLNPPVRPSRRPIKPVLKPETIALVGRPPVRQTKVAESTRPTPAETNRMTRGDWIVVGTALNLAVIGALAWVAQYTTFSALTVALVELGVLAGMGGIVAVLGNRQAGLVMMGIGLVPLAVIGLHTAGCGLALLTQSLVGKYLLAIIVFGMLAAVGTWVARMQKQVEAPASPTADE
jgi:hypothetical protein